jgi:hypothetical protein
VYGFSQAAVIEHAGILASVDPKLTPTQVLNLVLIADYGWSGRSELPGKLPYAAGPVFRRLYFDPPQPVVAQKGMALSNGVSKPITVGSLTFNVGDPIVAGHHRANLRGSGIGIALRVASKLGESAELGTLEVTTSEGKRSIPMRYGEHARSADDTGTVFVAIRSGATCGFENELSEKPVTITDIEWSPAQGGQTDLLGVTVF